ncbi:zinc ribbon domain-containing protein [Domibacillus sp. PGB-M46]
MWKKGKKSLSVRMHTCPDCGLVLDRGHNAALNIEKAGLAQTGLIPAK